MTALSVLDLTPIVQGGDARGALRNAVDLARHCEDWGYERYWLAEHHNMPGVASAATSIVIAHVAAGTSTIRVGAGGIMLPNHAPFVIAEQFGTLEALFPGRIDLGLGRAPGTDPLTVRALRRSPEEARHFPEDVLELMAWFREAGPDQPVRAVPGAGAKVPIWILGSSLFGAQLAAELGLPFAFASHFAPGQLMEAIAIYRASFTPSESLREPYFMIGANVIAAETNEEAEFLASSLKQAFVQLRRGRPSALAPPNGEFERTISAPEQALLAQALACSVIGGPLVVRRGLDDLKARTGAHELIVSAHIFDHAKRLRSLEITAQAHHES